MALGLGLRAVEFDVLHITHTPRAELLAQWPNVAEPHAVVFTSANAVNAIVSARMLREATQRPIARIGIGLKTHSRLDAFGIMATMPPQATAAHLGEWLVAEYPQVRAVIHPCAANSRPELAEALVTQPLRIAYHPVVAYTTQHTVSAPRLEALATSGLDAILLTSPAVAAAILAPWPGTCPLPRLLAIGPTTAQYLTHRGLPCETAPQPSLESLLQLAAQEG